MARREDASTLPKQLHADVCIVGSGAAALSLAHRLREQKKTVIILEGSNKVVAHSGMKPDDSEEHSSEGETEPSLARYLSWHRRIDPIAHALYEGNIYGAFEANDPFHLARSRARCYGGTTNCWGGWTLPLHPVDFDRRDISDQFVWPFHYDDLAPYYRIAMRNCSLNIWPLEAYFDKSLWVKISNQMFTPPTLLGEVLSPAAIAVIENTPTDDTLLAFHRVWGQELEQYDHIRIITNAHVRFINTSPGNRSVSSISFSTLNRRSAGSDMSVSATLYVLAAGGVEVPRLMLYSDALGNHSGDLGRHFMVHPVIPRAAVVRGDMFVPEAHRRFFNGYDLPNRRHSPSLRGILLPAPQILYDNKLGNFRLRLNADIRGPRYGSIDMSWEQFPSRENKVSLSKTLDRLFGDPQAEVHSALCSGDYRTVGVGLKLSLENLYRNGIIEAYKLQTDPAWPGEHHMGATRMSTHSSSGVVDLNCKVHNVDNLYVASGSVFPTAGFANPTLTIIALATRLADHLGRLSVK